MAPPTLVPNKTTLRRWKKGLTQSEMVARHEKETGIKVSRPAIAAAMVRYGLSEERPRHMDTLPWAVKMEHLGAYPARMLRLLGRRRSGMSLKPENERRLDSWLAHMKAEKVVVAYDPDDPDGFHYIDAKYGDVKGIPIRKKEISIADSR